MLLEAPFDKSRIQKNSALLTIDLTTAVADEAIKNRNSIVVAYRKSHPRSQHTCNRTPRELRQISTIEPKTNTTQSYRPNHLPRPEIPHLRRHPTKIPPPPRPTWNQRLLPPHSSRHRPRRHGRLALRRSDRELQPRANPQHHPQILHLEHVLRPNLPRLTHPHRASPNHRTSAHQVHNPPIPASLNPRRIRVSRCRSAGDIRRKPAPHYPDRQHRSWNRTAGRYPHRRPARKVR